MKNIKEIIVTAIVTAILGGTAPFWWSTVFPPKPPSRYDSVGPISVASIEHSDGSLGKYFHFYRADLDKALQREDWNNAKLWIVRGTAAQPKLVRVWRKPNGGSKGDAHGRYEKGEKPGDWGVNDEFYVTK